MNFILYQHEKGGVVGPVLESLNNFELYGEYDMKYQYANPFKGSVYYDHGLISSLIFLRIMNEEYARHRHNQISYVPSTRIIWHESFLSGSILQTAIAIALHNLDQHKEVLQQARVKSCIFDLEAHPLAWLLKISDTSQEWDKPMLTRR